MESCTYALLVAGQPASGISGRPDMCARSAPGGTLNGGKFGGGPTERRQSVHGVVMCAFGPASVLRPGEFADPPTRNGWATVALRASAVNWHDVLVRQGRYNSPLPHIIGADGAGVRTDTGEDVVIIPSLHWGERDEAPADGWEILGDHLSGTYAELVSVPIACLAPKPAGFDWAQAAALPLVGLTTYRALFTRGRLRRANRCWYWEPAAVSPLWRRFWLSRLGLRLSSPPRRPTRSRAPWVKVR